MSVCMTVDRITAKLQWCESVCFTRGKTIARQVLNCRWHDETAARERPVIAVVILYTHVSARATKEESRCEVRPTLSPSKRLTTFRLALRAARSVAKFLGEKDHGKSSDAATRKGARGRRLVLRTQWAPPVPPRAP